MCDSLGKRAGVYVYLSVNNTTKIKPRCKKTITTLSCLHNTTPFKSNNKNRTKKPSCQSPCKHHVINC